MKPVCFICCTRDIHHIHDVFAVLPAPTFITAINSHVDTASSLADIDAAIIKDDCPRDEFAVGVATPAPRRVRG